VNSEVVGLDPGHKRWEMLNVKVIEGKRLESSTYMLRPSDSQKFRLIKMDLSDSQKWFCPNRKNGFVRLAKMVFVRLVKMVLSY
jgi:hypothetical protein